MIGPVVHALRIGPIAAGTEDAGTGSERREELVGELGLGGVGKLAHDALRHIACDRVILEHAGPVGVHADLQRLVVEQLRGPFDGVDLGNLGRDDQPGNFEQFVRRDVLVPDDRIEDGAIS